MSDDLHLEECKNCKKLIRDQASYCWNCFAEPPLTNGIATDTERIIFRFPADYSERSKRASLSALVMMHRVKAPIEPFLGTEFKSLHRGVSFADVLQECEKPNFAAESDLINCPEAGWIKSMVKTFRPDLNQLDFLLQFIAYCARTKEHAPVGCASPEQFWRECLDVIAQYEKSAASDYLSYLQICRHRQSWATTLYLHLNKLGRKAEGMPFYDLGNWNPAAEEKKIRIDYVDNAGAQYFYPGLCPDNLFNWNDLGRASHMDGHYHSATVWFKRCLAVIDKKLEEQFTLSHQIERPYMLGKLGRVLIDAEQFEEAEPVLEEALKTWPADDRFLFPHEFVIPIFVASTRLALIKARLKKYDEAEVLIKQTLSDIGKEPEMKPARPKNAMMTPGSREQESLRRFVLALYQEILQNSGRDKDAQYLAGQINMAGYRLSELP